MERIIKKAFCVIGKIGSTNDGDDFIKKLWDDANGHFDEIASLAKKDSDGNLAGIWGAMSDFSFAFKPWEDDFSKGFYLAGIEVNDDAVPPAGWKKWILPGFEALKVEITECVDFRKVLAQMKDEGLSLAAAIQDFTDPATGKFYNIFPIALDNSKLDLIRKFKETTDQLAPCGFNCAGDGLCPFKEYCGGCRSACNMCSYAMIAEDNQCENMRCSAEKGLYGCYDCPELENCNRGFFGNGEEGRNCKQAARYVRDNLRNKK